LIHSPNLASPVHALPFHYQNLAARSFIKVIFGEAEYDQPKVYKA
jgi:hypothetical protein